MKGGRASLAICVDSTACAASNDALVAKDYARHVRIKDFAVRILYPETATSHLRVDKLNDTVKRGRTAARQKFSLPLKRLLGKPVNERGERSINTWLEERHGSIGVPFKQLPLVS